jgi:OFA family oxalate/formate antiporter-like MFS transporter
MMLAFLVQGANMFAFSYYTTPALVLVGASITGLCYGTIFTLMPAATADFYGVRNLGVNYGMVFTGFGAAGVLGPLLGGYLADQTGTFGTSYVMAGAMLMASALLSLVVRRRRQAPAAKPEPAQAAS